MIVYIEGKTLVKGVQSKDVYYIGTVEDDGYIYFNDKIAYRLPTPSNIQENVNVNLSDVQVLYPSRKAWVRANYFTELKCIGVDPKGIYSDLDGLDSRVADLESWRLVYVDPTLQDHGDRLTSVEGRLTTVEQRVTDCENAITTLQNWQTTINNWKTNTVDPFISTIRTWKDNTVDPFITEIRNWKTNDIDPWKLQVGVLNPANPSASTGWMNTLQRGILDNADDIDDINALLGPLASLFSGSQTSLQEYLRDRANYVNGKLDDIGVLNSVDYTLSTGYFKTVHRWINQNSDDIATLGNNYSSLSQLVGNLNTLVDTLDRLVQTIDQQVNDIINDMNDWNDRTEDLRTWVNDLGHMSLGDGSTATWTGNGENLIDTINLLNTVINTVNNLHGTSMTPLLTSIYNNWTTKTFRV